MNKYFVGRGILHPEKLAIAEKLRGKPLVDRKDATDHNGVAEIRLCPYMYWCSLNAEFGWRSMRDYEIPIREAWVADGILKKDRSIPTFTAKGKRFVEYVLKWAYPTEYVEMVMKH